MTHPAAKTIASILLVLAVIGLAALSLLPRPHHDLLLDTVLDAGHVPLHALFAALALHFFRTTGRCSTAWAAVLALGLTVAVGAFTELLQYFGPRDADLGDLGRDLLGGLAGILMMTALAPAHRGGRGQGRRLRVVLGTTAVLLAASALLPVAAVVRDRQARDAAFPTLLDFESRSELRFVSLRGAWIRSAPRPPAWGPDPDQQAGYLTFLPGEYPGLSVLDVVPDWSAYSTFTFEAFVPDSTSVQLLVRIDDREHDGRYGDRFDAEFVLTPGVNRICIDLSEVEAAPRRRRLDLRNVRSITFFGDVVEQRRSIYLDNVRLRADAPCEHRLETTLGGGKRPAACLPARR